MPLGPNLKSTWTILALGSIASGCLLDIPDVLEGAGGTGAGGVGASDAGGGGASGLSPGGATLCAGPEYSCAIFEGALYCWGNAPNGASAAPALVGGDDFQNVDAVAIACGEQHACGLTSDGHIFCWGRDSEGQVGDDCELDAVDVTEPKVVVDCAAKAAGPLTGYVRVVAAGNTSCGVRQDGAVGCWGVRVGDATPGGTLFEIVAGLSVTTALGLAPDHACARTEAGVACWGDNDYGELGPGASGPGPSIVEAVAADQLALAIDDSCALDAGALRCWGRPAPFMELPVASPPLSVPAPAPLTSIALGASHACAVADDQAAYCWGEDTDGQLGNGPSNTASYAAQGVLGEVAWSEIAVGARHTCARSTSGSVFCWGANDVGQSGRATGDLNVPDAALSFP